MTNYYFRLAKPKPMPDRSRIPVKTSQFNSYINSTADFLFKTSGGTPHWQRLGLTLQNANDWQDRRTDWKSDIYKAYTTANLKTKTAVDNVGTFKKDFRRFAMPLLDKISVSDAATNLDENIFNLKRSGKNHHRTFHETAIKENCFASVHPLGGGDLKITCSAAEHLGKALPPGADAVQLSYEIASEPVAKLDLALRREVFSRARFTLKAGLNNRSKWLNFSVRWYNTRHPHLSGPWSDVLNSVIA